ncbi:MAG: AAA family ATPase [Coriobacteriia bacterium]|nr:AAA family ATPase [Coriobacteriia bacterium]
MKRSVQGLTGAHSKNKSSQPRGALYFAGPTGVGKTEMAKAIAELIFADEQALIRFDMSEFQDNHAKVRLIGAPPGYVGYGGGGELTNAIEKRPHSIILFDEMDKAGNEVYDLFLQILSDGRLTDGQGRTVSFSECLIIFTSNQGVAANTSELKKLDLDNPSDVVRYETTIKEEVKKKFFEDLNRPELFGRIGGDNIVAFHPIYGEVAATLVNKFIDNVLTNVRLNIGNVVEISDHAREQLQEEASKEEVTDMGGRGITTCIEKYLTNPLSRRLFGVDVNQNLTITSLCTDEDGLPSLEIE